MFKRIPHSSTATPALDADGRAIVGWGLVAGAACLAEHAALWRYQDRWGGFWRPIPYVIGLGTVLGALTGYHAARGQLRAAGAAWGIAALAGAATVLAYTIRARGASGGTHVEKGGACGCATEYHTAPGWRVVR